MQKLPKCPACGSEYTYEDNGLYVCPECANEWAMDTAAASADQKRIVRDANGNELNDGDSVTVIKDLKVRGSSSVVKVGTKVKNIRLVDGDHGHGDSGQHGATRISHAAAEFSRRELG